ncbi:MAG TPA: LPS export ABC transporter periplasmic protein LptC [Pyrinomonadaceae bacterium]|jgi:lipopolysaccharide export system protein LptA|nr:LPS export ABC transporter periplasmic protein LptC [Pyrinomonadaceae bacterium]
MQEITKKRAIAIGLRARAPLVVRAGALLILAAALIFVAVSYYRLRNNKPFRLVSGPPELSKEIKGIVEGYEQRLMKDGRLYLWLRAARDITFTDDHHELQQVNLAVYPPVGEKPDQITANKAIYDPKTSVITFLGNVKVETKDALKVSTETIAYDQNSEIAQTEAPISFDRENVSGHSTGAVVESKTKKLQLKHDVEITVAPAALKDSKQPKSATSRSQPVTIRSAQALFEQESMKMTFSGGVTAEQDRDLMSGETLYATLNEQKHLQKLEVRTNSYLRTMTEGRAAEVNSIDMDFFLDKDQRLERAVATRNAGGKTLDADSDLQLTGANLIEVLFQAQGDRSLLKQMRTEGRSVINLSAPKSKAGDPRAANKRLTADTVKLNWRVTGRDLDKAEAVGNAELFVDPVVKNAAADTKTLTAPRIDCDFFESGNNLRTAVATGGSKAVIQPVQKVEDRGTRTLTSWKMTGTFVPSTQDLERMDAQTDAKFNENDRNGVATNISFTAADNTVRLRGGEPTVWDSRARTKGEELDSDLTNKVSYSRGKTATTYYSQEQTNGATPFSKVKSPVYVVGDRGEFHSESGVAIYTGNARAWQDDNFVRADKLTIYVNDKRMDGNGHVQSQIYNARRRIEGASSTIPVFATGDSMTYSDVARTLHYQGNVDIRQGTDRLTSEVADVYLQKESSEVEKTIAQRNVVMTQPNRKGTGDWVQYTSADEVAVLKGNPARVEDAEKGSTEGNRLTVYMRDGRVVADDVRGSQAPGRIKSTHKVKKQ